ncbi:MAG: alkaline phosphatase D family protein [Bacteriovoracia bacterium]
MVLAALILWVGGAHATPVPSVESTLTRFSFGSCNHQTDPQNYWESVAKQAPQLWVWLGDNIYADLKSPSGREKEWNRLKRNPFFVKFAGAVPMIGTWDDHDYGDNNVGKNYKHRRESQQLFLDFFGFTKDSPQRAQEGIYQTWTYGPTGRQVRVILPDERYFRDVPGPDSATILGPAQWIWLEKVLREDEAQLTIIGSSTQVVSMGTGGDTWGGYPTDRARLFQRLVEGRARGRNYLVISGDRHFTEVATVQLADGKPLYDFTSSGLTHVRVGGPPRNPARVGKGFVEKNYGSVVIEWPEEKGGKPRLTLEARKAANGELLQSLPLAF